MRKAADEGSATEPLYAAFLEQLPISGLSIAVFDTAGSQSTVWASNPTAARIEELQFDLGEGPHWKALATSAPVLIDDLRDDDGTDWPIFLAAVSELDVAAVFAFPLRLAGVTVGVVDLYRSLPGTLDQREYARAIALTDRVAKHAVQVALRGADAEGTETRDNAPAMRREVHQATGVVLVQLGVTATEAFFLLRAFAFSHELTVLQVAVEVLAGRVDFSRLAD